MLLLTYNYDFLKQKCALLTASEIAGQPDLWNDIIKYFYKSLNDIEKFLQTSYSNCNSIILTGAGTSAFIGLSLTGAFFRNTKIITRAIATTDIVSNPHDFLNENQTPLIISFARSGNSPESCAVIDLADKLCKKCFHFIVTCDENGALAQYNSINPAYIFVLPEKANDRSLAMTGSYSGMLLTGLLIAYIHHKQKIKSQIELLIQAAENIFSYHLPILKKIAEKNFKRAVFLGSGNLFGTATESALKLQELTDGQIICKEDTYLGIRHGPKAVIDETTLVIYFFSSDDYIKRYEKDLVNAMKNGNNAMFKLGINQHYEIIDDLDAQINFSTNDFNIDEDFFPVCAVLAGQLLGFYKSLQLGLKPDAPSVNGSISRVVQGVSIYALENEKMYVAGSNN